MRNDFFGGGGEDREKGGAAKGRFSAHSEEEGADISKGLEVALAAMWLDDQKETKVILLFANPPPQDMKVAQHHLCSSSYVEASPLSEMFCATLKPAVIC